MFVSVFESLGSLGLQEECMGCRRRGRMGGGVAVTWPSTKTDRVLTFFMCVNTGQT